METIAAACITGVLTLLGVVHSNSKSRAVMECKIDALTERVEKHNHMIERTYKLEQDMAVARNDIEQLQREKSDGRYSRLRKKAGRPNERPACCSDAGYLLGISTEMSCYKPPSSTVL